MFPFSALPLRPLRGATRPAPAWACWFAGSFACFAAAALYLVTLSSTDPEFESRWVIGAVLCTLALLQLVPANLLFLRSLGRSVSGTSPDLWPGRVSGITPRAFDSQVLRRSQP